MMEVVADESLVELAGLPGWTVQPGIVATFAPVEGGWLARIRQTIVPGKTYRVWHVSLVDPTGVARYTRTVSLLSEARRYAEGLVRGQQPR